MASRQTNAETLRQQIGGHCGEGVDLGDFAAAHAAAPRRCQSQLLRNNDSIHMRIVNASIDVAKGGRESSSADVLDVVVGNSFLATIRTGDSSILTAVRRDYGRDFEQQQAAARAQRGGEYAQAVGGARRRDDGRADVVGEHARRAHTETTRTISTSFLDVDSTLSAWKQL
jgi:hypothetical protein